MLPYQRVRRLGSREQVLDGEQDDAQRERRGPDNDNVSDSDNDKENGSDNDTIIENGF